MTYGFYFDMTSCVGCRACQVACKDKNDLPLGVTFRNVSTYETGSYPTPGYYHYSASCNHCSSPACVANCPTQAMYISDDGVVLHDDGACIGCQTCVNSCPYAVPQYVEESNIVKKCDMCQDLTSEGKNPVCVDACSMRCLEWGDVDDLAAAHPEAVKDISILPDSATTNPNTILNPKKAALDSDYRRRYI